MTPLLRTLKLLALLAPFALLTGCPGVDSDDILGTSKGTFTISNAGNVGTLTSVSIVGSCLVGDGGWVDSSTSIANGTSASYEVDGYDSYDVRACVDASECYIWYNEYIDGGETVTLSTASGLYDATATQLANCGSD